MWWGLVGVLLAMGRGAHGVSDNLWQGMIVYDIDSESQRTRRYGFPRAPRAFPPPPVIVPTPATARRAGAGNGCMDDYELPSQLSDFYGQDGPVDGSWLACATEVGLKERELRLGTRTVCESDLRDVSDEQMTEFSVDVISTVEEVCGGAILDDGSAGQRTAGGDVASDPRAPGPAGPDPPEL